MTRKLFAFLAMLSGLVALSGPAAASYSSAASPCNASVSASADAIAASEHVQAEFGQTSGSIAADEADIDPPSPTPHALRLPVLMGIERAYE
ncbi:hypothetical protein [Erythrobacter sp. MTPC3]|uniref:hypothetical protein n=1 Tax=Erythrobacter sp. MTPC3 TaxID=3056564 RepID=UPI0036F3F167